MSTLTCNDVICLLSLSTVVLSSIVCLIGRYTDSGPTQFNSIVITSFGVIFSIPPVIMATSQRYRTLGRLALGASLALLTAFIFLPSEDAANLTSIMFLPLALAGLISVLIPVPASPMPYAING